MDHSESSNAEDGTHPPSAHLTETTRPRPGRARKIGLWLAPIAAVSIYLILPTEVLGAADSAILGLTQPGRVVAGVGVLMAVLWVTEAIPIAATALLPVALFPLLTGGAIDIRSATAPFAHELIFLFMGGFLIALAMQQWGLHRRIALHIIRRVGTGPRRLVGGFMLASAFLSMWVSNTATVVMMLPIAMSVVELLRRQCGESDSTASGAEHPGPPFHFAICLMLGTAYASSIGGIGTLIGTPPNLILAAVLRDSFGVEITFVRWMGVGVPLVLVFLPVTWWLLTRVVFPVRSERLSDSADLIDREIEKQGPMCRGEWLVLVVFVLTAVSWITRPLLNAIELADGVQPLRGLTDAGIAMSAGLVLFVLPVSIREGVFVLTWRQALKLPWGILILFGGGLSLAAAAKDTGVAAFIGQGASGYELPAWALMLVVTTTIVFLTELTSNTATTATFLPILGAVAIGLGMDPLLLAVPAAIAASCAFMMPVATPPNAIVFSSGELTIPQMCKAGLWLNLIGIALVMLLVYLVAVPVFAITLS